MPAAPCSSGDRQAHAARGDCASGARKADGLDGSVPKPWPGGAAMKLTVAGRLASPSSMRCAHATSMRPVVSIAA
jgi:hypothetical protein